MTKFRGVIIEESLENKEILKKVKIIETKFEQVSEEHQTPWIKQWTLHTVEVPENLADSVAKELSASLDREHDWYADFKNDKYHYVIFYGKVFRVSRSKPKEYDEVKKYGMSLGIPDYQLDFSPEIK